jgi:hypothetical protein
MPEITKCGPPFGNMPVALGALVRARCGQSCLLRLLPWFRLLALLRMEAVKADQLDRAVAVLGLAG